MKKIFSALIAVVLVACIAVGGIFFFYNKYSARNPVSALTSSFAKTDQAESFNYEIKYKPLLKEYNITGKVYRDMDGDWDKDLFYMTKSSERLLTVKNTEILIKDGKYTKTETLLNDVDTVYKDYEDYFREQVEKIAKNESLTGVIADLYGVFAYFPMEFSDSFEEGYEILRQAYKTNKNFDMVDFKTMSSLMHEFFYDYFNDEGNAGKVLLNAEKTEGGGKTIRSFDLDIEGFVGALRSFLEQKQMKDQADVFLALYDTSFDKLAGYISTALDVTGFDDNALHISYTVEDKYLTSLSAGDFLTINFTNIGSAVSRQDAESVTEGNGN